MLSSDKIEEEEEEVVSPDGPFVHYSDENRRKSIIRKNILCWIYSNIINKLNNDRTWIE